MKLFNLTLLFAVYSMVAFGQKELELNFDKIKATIENKESEYYYPKLLKRWNDFDASLTLEEYSLIYYGFSFQDQYIKDKPDEKVLNDLAGTEDYEKILIECQKILQKNPLSLLANDQMGYTLFKLKRPELEWRKYQNRYRAIRKVIAYSGNGLSSDTAFKVINVSDEYNMIYKYFNIEKIYNQSLIGSCDKFVVEPSENYKVKEIYFDISRNLIQLQHLNDVK